MPVLGFDTPTGPFGLVERDGAIVRAEWGLGGSDETPLLVAARAQVAEYFAGTRRDFALPLRVEAGDFQRRACDRIAAIPFGETITYGDMARDLGVSAQAAGRGCGGNPLALIVPCHRVLGASGLGGFSGAYGIETKVWLLRHEGAAGLLI